MNTRKIESSVLQELAITGCAIKQMSEHFKCTDESVRRALRRFGFLDQWKELRCEKHGCEHCGRPSADQFCSTKCLGFAQRKSVDAAVLAPYVESGTPLLHMSAELKVNRALLRSALIRNGQFKQWAQRRYKKCASRKVGATSASTAFGEAIAPSAKLVVHTAGRTSCGG